MATQIMSVEKKIEKARIGLTIGHPFFASLMFRMPMELDETLNPRTLATDGRHIWVHPEWVDQHTTTELSWAIAHEIMHCVFEHMYTVGDRNPQKWNIAADYVINQLLEDDCDPSKSQGSWMKRPDGVLFDPALFKQGGGTTEGIYNLLPDPPPQGGQGQGQGQGAAWDMMKDPSGSQADRAQAQAEMKVSVSQAAAAAKAMGRLSSTMERFVGDLLTPKIAWQDALRRFMMRQTRSDRSFSRPSRRFLHMGEYMPGRSGVGMGDIIVAVDCSGSIGEQELKRFATEMSAIKSDAMPSRMHILYFADSVSKHDEFGSDEELEIKPGRSGGTAFSPIFKFANDRGISPDCCVVLTDLYCNDFGPAPEYPVLWVSTHADQAPWGEVVMMGHD